MLTCNHRSVHCYGIVYPNTRCHVLPGNNVWDTYVSIESGDHEFLPSVTSNIHLHIHRYS